MGERYRAGGRFTLRSETTEKTYRADAATATVVRHPGGTALALSVRTVPEAPGFGPESAEYAIGPGLSVVLDGADEWRGDPPSWDSRRGGSPPGPVSILWLYDMHPIDRLTVELLGEAGDRRLYRLRGEAGVTTFDVRVTAHFAGTFALDPAGGGWWQGHATAGGPAWPAGEPLTEPRWQAATEFRRMVREYFPEPNRTAPAAPPEGRLARFARRVGLRRPEAVNPPRPVNDFTRDRADPRRTQLLLAALVDRYLAGDESAGSPDRFRNAARIIERFADGAATADDRARTAPIVDRACYNGADALLNDYSPASARLVFRMAHFDDSMLPQSYIWRLFPDRCGAGCDLLRCVLGNPFRPVVVAPRWRTAAAVAIAGDMYASRDFAAMPVLADALEDAGCTDARVLDHCRGPGRHARGCWVVDGLLATAEPAPPTRAEDLV